MKQKISMTVTMKLDVEVEAETLESAKAAVLERLDGMTITANDENWCLTLSEPTEE